MQQLTGVDANFLHMETPATFGHVASVSILDPSDVPGGLTFDAVRSVVENRLSLLPPLRRRLAEVPFGLDRPYWVEDPDFDIDFHVRELALPAPGDQMQLAEQVARIAARPLDRTRPLWEFYLIWGLEGGQVAMMGKFHHAAVDGVAGRELMTTLLDPTPEPREVPASTWKPDPVPTETAMFVRGLAGLATQPMKFMQFQQRMLQNLPRMASYGSKAATSAVTGRLAAARGGDGGLLSAPSMLAPRTSFNRTITPHRRWAFGTLPLAEVKGVKSALGVTLNDVVMALCAGALRQWLTDHDELPEVPLLAMVPISVRAKEQAGTFGNRVSAMIASLPTNLADPRERVQAAHEAMLVAKEQHQAIGADVLQDVAQFTMPALAARAARVAAQMRIADVVNPPFNVVIYKVPGPRTPLYLAGARMLGYYPVSAIADGQGLNITVQSYLDSLDFGLLACRELVPDVWNIMGYLDDALTELREIADVPEAAVRAGARSGGTATDGTAAKRPARRRRA